MTPSPPLGISEPPSSVTRIFPGTFANLASIGQFVRGEAQKAGLDDTAVYQVEMAVDEACSNIIEHAYGGEGRGEIHCSCRRELDSLVIVLTDEGKSFNPEQIKLPDLKATLEERDSHGLGLFFIHEWMDRVNYRSLPSGGNILTLVKYRDRKKTGKKK
jgi:serine/threonine-protein kinase RsbW